MIFEYSFDLPVGAEVAWPILLDVYRVAPCMPGASIESGEGNAFAGRIKVRLGPVEMVYRGDLQFIHRDDVGHELVVEGAAKDTKGGGGAKATVRLTLAALGPDRCQVAIHSTYSVSGKAAQFGRGLMEEVGEKLMREFAARLDRLIVEDAASSGSGAPQGESLLASPPPPAGADEALDIGAAAGWAVARRVIVPGIIVLVLLAAWWALHS